MLEFIFSAVDANDIYHKKPVPQSLPVKLKFLFGTDFMGREKDMGNGMSYDETFREIETGRVLYVFLKQ